MTCPDCEGEGRVELSLAHQCTRRVGECCGGCTREVVCPTCQGARVVDDDDEDTTKGGDLE